MRTCKNIGPKLLILLFRMCISSMYDISTFLNDFGSWKIWSEEEKARSQLFWVWRIQFNEVVLNPEDPKNVGWGLFLPQFIILKLKKELKMHFFYTRSLFFPAFIFFPVSPETKKIGAGKKSDPLYRKKSFTLLEEHINFFEIIFFNLELLLSLFL